MFFFQFGLIITCSILLWVPSPWKKWNTITRIVLSGLTIFLVIPGLFMMSHWYDIVRYTVITLVGGLHLFISIYQTVGGKALGYNDTPFDFTMDGIPIPSVDEEEGSLERRRSRRRV